MNPILIDFGFIKIYWYSFLLFIAFFIGCFLVLRESKKHNIEEDFMVNLFFYTIPISFIGARLYYVIFNWEYYSVNLIDIFKIWEGGLAIHGGIIAAFIFLIFYTKKHNISLWKVTDILVVSLILGQAIGRWGNFFNGEAHGAITTLENLQSLHLPQFIIEGMHIGANYYIPTFLYESIWDLIGFILLFYFRKRKNNKVGQTTSLYLFWYGIGRVWIEGMRTDSLMLGPIRVAQLISIIMIIVGILLFYFQRNKERYQEWEGKNDTNL